MTIPVSSLGVSGAGMPHAPLSTGTSSTPVNTDKYQAKSMDVLPNGVNFKGSAETKGLKGALFTLATPLLLPFLAGHAVTAAMGNTVNKVRVSVRNDLADKRANVKAELEEKKGQLTQARNLLSDHDELVMDIQAKIKHPKNDEEKNQRPQLEKSELNLVMAMENARGVTIPSLKAEIDKLEAKMNKIDKKLQSYDASFDKSAWIQKRP